MQTIDKVLAEGNLTEACKEVASKKGSAGIDRMNVKELKEYLDNNRERLIDLIHSGNYIPQPIRGKELAKRFHDQRE